MSEDSALPPLDLQQRYTIPETADYLRICRAYVYRLIKRGELRTIKDGKRHLVPGTEIGRRSALSSAIDLGDSCPTKREVFAAMAMQSIISHEGPIDLDDELMADRCLRNVSKAAVRYADALLEQLLND